MFDKKYPMFDGQQLTSPQEPNNSYPKSSGYYGFNPYTGHPVLPGPRDGWGHEPWTNPISNIPLSPPTQVEGILRTRRRINPINQTDLLFCYVYDKFMSINTDPDLTKYWCFDSEYFLRLFEGQDFDSGRYFEGGVYVYRSVKNEAVMTTPYMHFIVNKNGIEIDSEMLGEGISDDNITLGLIPILRFVRSIIQDEVKSFNKDHNIPEVLNDEPVVNTKKQPKKGK